MKFVKGDLLYEGKAKKIFAVVDEPSLLWQEFKNSLTAFNGIKKGEFDVKGEANLFISAKIFKFLKSRGISSHFIDTVDSNIMITQKLKMIPLEVVVRNKVAGSLQKRLGLNEGEVINPALVEFYYKNDSLGDPLITDDHVKMLKIIDARQIDLIKDNTIRINTHLIEFFKKIDIDLVDFKIEFGLSNEGNIVLSDEISPDSCRLWDIKTHEKLDKDRFRYDLGDVKAGYINIYERIEKAYANI